MACLGAQGKELGGKGRLKMEGRRENWWYKVPGDPGGDGTVVQVCWAEGGLTGGPVGWCVQEADTVYVHTPLMEVLVKSTGALLSPPAAKGQSQ